MNLTHDLLQKAREIMSDPSTLGTTAAGLCLQILDDDGETECIHWDPDVLFDALAQILGDAQYVDLDVFQRLNAVSALLLTGDFFEEPETFHAICATLLEPDNNPAIGRMPPEPIELAWSCAEANILLGRSYDEKRFSDQVRRYCGVCLSSQGLSFPPGNLSFADFPGDGYPDASKYGNETLLTAWTDRQEESIGEIDEAVDRIAGMLKRQLAWLKPFGGEESAFLRLAGV